MKKLIVVLILLSLAAPVQAGMVRKYDPVEQELLQNRQLEQDLGREFKNSADSDKAITAEKTEEPGKDSSSWQWVLGIALVGGAVAAAGGHSGGGSSSSGGGSTGNGTITW